VSKKTRGSRPASADASGTQDGTNPKQPCPCGSGKRYKACHGSGDDSVIVLRPFEGLACEPDVIAVREFVPSAVATLSLSAAGSELAGDKSPRLVSVLPGAAAAMVRADGAVFVGLQTQVRTGDLSGDLARALRWALTADPGEVLPVSGSSLGQGEEQQRNDHRQGEERQRNDHRQGEERQRNDHRQGPVRLQDLLDADTPLDLTVYQDFSWWLPEGEQSPEVQAAVQQANTVIKPTEQVLADGVRGAYWVDAGEKAHLRWVRPEPESKLVAALARLQAADKLNLGEGSRYVGSFRAHGLLVPVWDLDREMHVKEWSDPAARFAGELEAALASIDSEPMTDRERRARDALAGRQVTLR
jgi:hypothetical protein